MNNEKKIIYEGKNIILYMDDVSLSKVVFSFTGYEGDLGKNLYGDGFIQKNGFSGFFFVSLQNHWWQTPELDEAIEMANKYTASHNVRISYGQSMGGYGALLSAGRLNSRALVTAPQTTINPKLALVGDVWLEEINKNPIYRDNVLEELGETKSVVVIYDNKGKGDVSHIKYIENSIGVKLYKIPYATHNLPETLKEMGIISQLISDFFNNENAYDRISFRKIIRKRRSESFAYLHRLGVASRQSKNKWLYDFYKKCIVSRIKKKISEDGAWSRNKIDDGFISFNSQVDVFDRENDIFISKGRDPQIFLKNIPKEFSVGKIVFYSSSASIGNFFFSRGEKEKFSVSDSIRFNVKPGVNVVGFEGKSEGKERVQIIRFDPISQVGFFCILSVELMPA